MRKSNGRIFKRIEIGDYFSSQKKRADSGSAQLAKQEKIDYIRELELLPTFLRYARKNETDTSEESIAAAYVIFQKEIYDEKSGMTYVTEISFIVPKEEFEEFERLAGVSLKEDFEDLSELEKRYTGEERRKSPRPSPFDQIEV